MTELGTFESIEDALRRYYKPERLYEPDTLTRLAASTQRDMERSGAVILASRHDNVTGHALYISPGHRGQGYTVWQS